jgi:hypothetical protein
MGSFVSGQLSVIAEGCFIVINVLVKVTNSPFQVQATTGKRNNN